MFVIDSSDYSRSAPKMVDDFVAAVGFETLISVMLFLVVGNYPRMILRLEMNVSIAEGPIRSSH